MTHSNDNYRKVQCKQQFNMLMMLRGPSLKEFKENSSSTKLRPAKNSITPLFAPDNFLRALFDEYSNTIQSN